MTFPAAPPRRILLTCTQRLGDVLLATPLLRSLKRAWPQAQVDMLVFADTVAVLEGNADVATAITVPRRAAWPERLRELRGLWRRYDLALSPLPTDRARLYCFAASPYRLGLLRQEAKDRAKGLLLNAWRYFDDVDTHSVAMGLALADLLGITAISEVVPPSIPPVQRQALLARLALVDRRYAVLHCHPKFRYKMWTSEAWLALAAWCRAQGLAPVFTGGAEAAERAYVGAIARGAAGLDCSGTLSLAQTAELITAAALYVGPDTVATHIAAASGTPTVALFGPSNPVKWGPWPQGWTGGTSPWKMRASGRQGNVFLLQGEDPRGCVPCLREGCERHVDSYSACLDNLTAGRVIAACATMLAV